MKKVLSLFILFLLAFIFVSCSQPANEQYSLQIWTYYNGTTQSSFEKIIDDYNNTRGKEKGIVVSSLSKGSQVNDLLKELLDSAQGKVGSEEMPDIFLAYPDCAFELDGYDKIASIDSYFSKEELSNFNEGYLNEGKFYNDNSLKILPVAKSTEALYINKTDFDLFLNTYPELNISYDDFNTVEGIINIAEAYYNKTGKAFFGRDSLDNYFVIGAKQLGIDILNYSNDIFGINFDKKVFKKLWESYYVPYVKGYFLDSGKYRSDAVKSGDILCYIGSTSSAKFFPNKVIDSETATHNIEAEIMPAPIFEGKEKYAVSQGAGFCVTKSNENREKACIDFLKWLCNKENINSFAELSGYFPSTKDGLSLDFISTIENAYMKKNFEICKITLEEYKMYTNIVGTNGTNYRNALRDYLANTSKGARNNVINQGLTEEAINEYTSNEKFEEWFNDLKKTIEANF